MMAQDSSQEYTDSIVQLGGQETDGEKLAAKFTFTA
jgi:hypothetical protein